MEIVIVLIVVGLLVVVALGVMGLGRSSRAQEDSPDRTEVTDTDVTPPAHPDRPVPGSQTDRQRKGADAEQDGSDVVRRWSDPADPL